MTGSIDEGYDAPPPNSTRLCHQTFLVYDGSVHRVRTDDLVHFSYEGAVRAPATPLHPSFMHAVA